VHSTWAHAYAHAHTYAHTHAHTHARTHTHTHTHTHTRKLQVAKIGNPPVEDQKHVSEKAKTFLAGAAQLSVPVRLSVSLSRLGAARVPVPRDTRADAHTRTRHQTRADAPEWPAIPHEQALMRPSARAHSARAHSARAHSARAQARALGQARLCAYNAPQCTPLCKLREWGSGVGAHVR